ncbi:hypothetical protein ACIBCH_09985 [Amycolatopsis thailandensis]|uniref:hypothetical protein n=1 Tax=Amycolatopsis thailandensis TaxID=589330 RepID=UPI0037973C3F
MDARKFAGIVAALIVIVGAILLFTGVSAATPGGATVSCGSAMKPDTKAASFQSDVDNLRNAMSLDAGYGSLGASSTSGFAQACDSAISTRRGWAWGLLGVGAVAFVGSIAIKRPTPA